MVLGELGPQGLVRDGNRVFAVDDMCSGPFRSEKMSQSRIMPLRIRGSSLPRTAWPASPPSRRSARYPARDGTPLVAGIDHNRQDSLARPAQTNRFVPLHDGAPVGRRHLLHVPSAVRSARLTSSDPGCRRGRSCRPTCPPSRTRARPTEQPAHRGCQGLPAGRAPKQCRGVRQRHACVPHAPARPASVRPGRAARMIPPDRGGGMRDAPLEEGDLVCAMLEAQTVPRVEQQTRLVRHPPLARRPRAGHPRQLTEPRATPKSARARPAMLFQPTTPTRSPCEIPALAIASAMSTRHPDRRPSS